MRAFRRAFDRICHGRVRPDRNEVGWCNPGLDFKGFQMWHWTSGTAANREKNPDRNLQLAEVRPFEALYQRYFPQCATHHCLVPLHVGGVVPAFREGVERTPLSIYRELLRQCSSHHNPEVGHYIERIWGLLVDHYD